MFVDKHGTTIHAGDVVKYSQSQNSTILFKIPDFTGVLQQDGLNLVLTVPKEFRPKYFDYYYNGCIIFENNKSCEEIEVFYV
jgi:hypothetical protein